MNPKQSDRLIKLAKDLSDIIYKYQRYMKPSEADKARQMNKLIKEINGNNRKLNKRSAGNSELSGNNDER